MHGDTGRGWVCLHRRAKGAVFSVTASNGVVKGLTLRIQRKRLFELEICNGSQWNLHRLRADRESSAADCGIRLNGRGTIQTGSVGAGAASFDIQPSSANSGFVVEALFCTDEESGYVRQEGGLKTDNFTGRRLGPLRAPRYPQRSRPCQFNLLETSGPHDDGVRIESACCGANFYSLHADRVHRGLSNHRRLRRRDSERLHDERERQHYCAVCSLDSGVPWRYDPGGQAEASPTFPLEPRLRPSTVHQMTVSQAATVTNGGQPACTKPALTGGSGLTLHYQRSLPPQPRHPISLHHPVANSSRARITEHPDHRRRKWTITYGAYLESNSRWISQRRRSISDIQRDRSTLWGFMRRDPRPGGTKYGDQSDTQFGWCMLGGISSAGFWTRT